MTRRGLHGRHFIVGCPRSGTTVLQSMLAAHPRVWSPPETHFFIGLKNALPGSRRARWRKIAAVHEETATLLGFRLRAHLYRPHRTISAARSFVAMMDQRTLHNRRDHWVEKTPDHVHAIDVIQSTVPDPSFIHLVRDGRAVVASLLDVTARHPDVWNGAWSIDRCIDAWNAAIAATREWTSTSAHLVVSYERLLAQPERQIARIALYLELDFDPVMVTDRASTAAQIVRDHEPWKHGLVEPLVDPGLVKFDALLSRDEQQKVLDRLDKASDLLALA